MSKNERITENLVRDLLRELKYYENPDTLVEEQKSHIEEVRKLLKGTSKTGKGGDSCLLLISNLLTRIE